MQRLDHSYMMRTSDCPQLKRKPSEYMQEMFYSSQPMEVPDDLSVLEATFKMIKAETQLVWSSDYPHWDFDLPSVIYDLPFLKEHGQAQHPRRQRGAAVQPRQQAGEEDSVAVRLGLAVRMLRPGAGFHVLTFCPGWMARDDRVL